MINIKRCHLSFGWPCIIFLTGLSNKKIFETFDIIDLTYINESCISFLKLISLLLSQDKFINMGRSFMIVNTLFPNILTSFLIFEIGSQISLLLSYLLLLKPSYVSNFWQSLLQTGFLSHLTKVFFKLGLKIKPNCLRSVFISFCTLKVWQIPYFIIFIFTFI